MERTRLVFLLVDVVLLLVLLEVIMMALEHTNKKKKYVDSILLISALTPLSTDGHYVDYIISKRNRIESLSLLRS